VGWAAVLGALATALGLMAATSAITTFCLALVLFGVAGLFLEDGPWRGLRWPMALAADAAVLAMTLLALAPGGSPELALDLRPAKVIALALALTAATLARFLYGALRRPEGVGAFQTLQTLAVLFLGLGGALRVAEAAGAGAAPLGLVTLLTGLGSYGCAFTFAGQEEDGTGAFRFLATLAFALVLAGSFLLLPPAGLALIWVGSGLAAGFMGRRTQRFSLHLHAAAFLGAAALASGLGTALMGAFLRPGPTLALFPPVAVLALAGLGAGHWLSPFPVDEVPPWPYRLPSLALGALGLLGAAALAVAACAPLAPSDAGALAALRTAALVGLAALLAGLSRFRPASPLTWLPYPLLACTVVKFLMEDMPRGRPITLFLALTLFGLALLAVPKWLRVEA